MKEPLKVLLCDDQNIIHETLKEYIQAEGFVCLHAYDGQQALQLFESEQPDFVILDLMMPKVSGLDVCKAIRGSGNVGLIMLTAKGEEIDRILGLELGADDYIVKPFSPREVVARLKAILRRMEKNKDENDDTLSFAHLSVSLAGYEVKVDGVRIDCTPKEVEVLYTLCSAVGRVFTREQLLNQVWGYDYYGDTRLVDTQIKRIRQKLPHSEDWGIKSIYGVGYKFEVKG
ncbi:MAG: response regulator transcription factor [Erysipelotrichaceae bacterium]|jgi:DNA-binding response OmpR family regulator|nr:response regulator transcription factor [Erysipelotrichaceae bacterium]